MAVKAEFDKLAKNYEEWHKEAVKASGFDIQYFYECRIKEIHRILKKHPQEINRILDFGCGIGNVDPYIRKYFPTLEILGVDISEESIHIANEKQNPIIFNMPRLTQIIKLWGVICPQTWTWYLYPVFSITHQMRSILRC
jgi:ubiquinone/menaquinone biosynthesis C-methylase UbiE